LFILVFVAYFGVKRESNTAFLFVLNSSEWLPMFFDLKHIKYLTGGKLIY